VHLARSCVTGRHVRDHVIKPVLPAPSSGSQAVAEIVMARLRPPQRPRPYRIAGALRLVRVTTRRFTPAGLPWTTTIRVPAILTTDGRPRRLRAP
jgi:hypothetical protein